MVRWKRQIQAARHIVTTMVALCVAAAMLASGALLEPAAMESFRDARGSDSSIHVPNRMLAEHDLSGNEGRAAALPATPAVFLAKAVRTGTKAPSGATDRLHAAVAFDVAHQARVAPGNPGLKSNTTRPFIPMLV